MIIPEADSDFDADEAPQVLDRPRLAELAGHRGEPLERELLEAFLIAASGDVARLRASAHGERLADLTRAAHALRVACQHVGAHALAAAAMELEMCARTLTFARGPAPELLDVYRALLLVDHELLRLRLAAEDWFRAPVARR